MIVQGKFNSAEVFTNDEIEPRSKQQIQDICDSEQYKDAVIKIMPDYHAGKGCVIGLTMRLPKNNPVEPNLVGVDIGCSVSMHLINPMYAEVFTDKNLEKLTQCLYSYKGVVKNILPLMDRLKMYNTLTDDEKKRVFNQIGTVGTGNHFIELDQAPLGFALVVHSGSRYLGTKICEYYEHLFEADPENLIGWYEDYLNDMQVGVEYATLNHQALSEIVSDVLGVTYYENYISRHNFIELRDNEQVVRKGAVEAYAGQQVIVPLNMKYGTILGTAVGNPEWNFSCPHGAGRVLSRSQAKKELELSDYLQEMQNVKGTFSKKNIDEAPCVYKDPSVILEAISGSSGTLTNIERYIPFYVFKN